MDVEVNNGACALRTHKNVLAKALNGRQSRGVLSGR